MDFKHMNCKKCVFCSSLNVIKKGKQGEHQRYYCKDCKKKFQANRKSLPNMEEIFYSFTFHKQTFKEVSKSYHMRTIEVQRMIDEFIIPQVVHSPREVNLLIDATYFGTRENKFCLIVFRDNESKRNLWWKFCDTEREIYYREGKMELERIGYVIKSITADGLPLFRRLFKSIPYQMCIVHMQRIIIRGTTLNPKLEASKALLALANSLFSMDEARFYDYMNKYTLKYFHFLNEKTTGELTGESWYTHDNLRSAFLSLQHLQDHLFTYKRDSKIPRDTNSIEGAFGNIKKKVKLHNGLSVKREKKIIEIFLYYGSGVYAYLCE
jgi:hypothetical protein